MYKQTDEYDFLRPEEHDDVSSVLFSPKKRRLKFPAVKILKIYGVFDAGKIIDRFFERDYAKVAWVKKNRLYVQYLPMLKNTDASVSLEVLLKEVSKILCLYDFPKDIKSINVGGLFDSTFDRFISSVILVASKIYPYAKISYDLRAFIEILTNKKLKSYT